MKILLSILGVLFIQVGAVWIFQGVNNLPGSFMTGQIQWAINGVFCVIVGAAWLYFANRRKSEKK